MKKMITMIACMLALTLCLTACGQTAAPTDGQSLAKGGILVLSVNPEIAVEYDENGIVTGVTARNDDALAIINSCTGLIGQPTGEVVTDLVTAIGEAGYFVEEIDGHTRQITLEIEHGSSLPSDTFLDDVVTQIRDLVSQHDWTTPLMVEGATDYGFTDYIHSTEPTGTMPIQNPAETVPPQPPVGYVDTDYGPNNDGVTDYDDTDYGPNNDGVTDYIDTDYGPNNDGVTDYIDTDYGPNNDGVTDYTDYGTQPTGTTPTQGMTDYIDTDYGPNNDGVTDYEGNTDYEGRTDYENHSDYGDSRYD